MHLVHSDAPPPERGANNTNSKPMSGAANNMALRASQWPFRILRNTRDASFFQPVEYV